MQDRSIVRETCVARAEKEKKRSVRKHGIRERMEEQMEKAQKNDSKDNLKQAMYEMFGVGSGASDQAEGGKEQRPAENLNTRTYIAFGTTVKGNLKSTGDIEIAGDLQGDIETRGKVLLRSNIQGNIRAGSLQLQNCELIGDIEVNGLVTISESSRVQGNIKAKELFCNGSVNGDLFISGNTELAKQARIDGKITTETMVVTRGAVLCGGVEMNRR